VQEDLEEAIVWAEDLGQGMDVFVDHLEHREGSLPPDRAGALAEARRTCARRVDEQPVDEDRAGMAGTVRRPRDAVPALRRHGRSLRPRPGQCGWAMPDARAVLFGGLGHEEAFDNGRSCPTSKPSWSGWPPRRGNRTARPRLIP
jgi:hypothetical protein